MRKCFWCDTEHDRLTRDHIVARSICARFVLHDIRRSAVVKCCDHCNRERSKISAMYAAIHGKIAGKPEKLKSKIKRLADKYKVLIEQKVPEPAKKWALYEINEVLTWTAT